MDSVFVLSLGEGENRFTPGFLDEVAACIAEVQATPPPRALVTTATGKFFSTGLDLDWIAEHPRRTRSLVTRFQDVLAALLTCNAFTVAAMQGHAFGGGGLLALAHDAVLMRTDRGYFCLPEVDLPVAFTDGMTSLLLAKLPAATAAASAVTGRRYSADQAVRSGIAVGGATADSLLPEALTLAGQHANKDPGTLGTMKERLYSGTSHRLRHLGEDLPRTFPGYEHGLSTGVAARDARDARRTC